MARSISASFGRGVVAASPPLHYLPAWHSPTAARNLLPLHLSGASRPRESPSSVVMALAAPTGVCTRAPHGLARARCTRRTGRASPELGAFHVQTSRSPTQGSRRALRLRRLSVAFRYWHGYSHGECGPEGPPHKRFKHRPNRGHIKGRPPSLLRLRRARAPSLLVFARLRSSARAASLLASASQAFPISSRA